MDIIPLDPGLIRGSHGVVPADKKDWPLVISDRPANHRELKATEVYNLIWGQLTA
jgi:hypothetical protein